MVPEIVWRIWRERFDGEPEVASSAPGRVNLIGEHTDYNEGFVFPAAIDRRTYGLFRATEGKSELFSEQAGQALPFEPGEIPERGWGRYAAACASSLRDASEQRIPSIEGVVWSDIPNGSGLSSSAALELCLLGGWNELCDLGFDNKRLAQIGWRSENDYVGMDCGVMDQMASAMGRQGHAMFLDTRSLEASYWPIPDDVSLAVLDTGKPRALASSAYNERVAECRRAVAEIAKRRPGVVALRDATLEDLASARGSLDQTAYKRARHVIAENGRTLEFRRALAESDRKAMGELCKASHVSLRDDYEVSCPELDAMVRAAENSPGCIATRLTGAGFGGCCVALVEKSTYGDFERSALTSYEMYGFARPRLFETFASTGASSAKLRDPV